MLGGKQQRRERRRRVGRIVMSAKVLQLVVAFGIAIVTKPSSTLFALAFAPPQPNLNSLPTAINLPAQYCDQRNDIVITSKQKQQRRRRRYQYMSLIDDDDDNMSDRRSTQIINENETTETATTQKNNTLDEFGNVRPKQTTISGGTSLIFEMARRMLVWDDELYESGMLNDASGSESVLRNEQRSGGGGNMSPTPPSLLSLPSEKLTTLSSTTAATTKLQQSNTLPRWRPSAIRQQTISNVNPNFRSSSPVMTNAGYASILRRNSRKKNKPSMWKHCLRTYNKMAELEKELEKEQEVSSLSSRKSNDGENRGGGIPGVGYTDNLSSSASSASIPPPQGTRRKKRIKRTTAHHEAALVAASKLGEWELAVSIFRQVESSLAMSNNNTTTISAAAVSSSNNDTSRRGMNNRVTDNMILSVITACVKGSKVKRTLSSIPPPVVNADTGSNPSNATEGNIINVTSSLPSRPMLRELTVGERRRPLDAARDIILSMESKHDIPLVARHINPLSSAYNRLGLRSEATTLINEHLKDRIPPPPPPKNHHKKPNHNWKAKRDLVSDNQYQDKGFEAVRMVEFRNDDLEDDEDDVGYEESQLNVHQMKSKDRASYSLLVQAAAMDGDWTSAVKELQRMTEAGLHPNTRNLNSWNEVMERGCRPTGNGEKDHISSTNASYGKKKRDVMWLGNLR